MTTDMTTTPQRSAGHRTAWAILAAGAMVAGSIAATGLVIAQTETGDQYTGCLATKGTLGKVAIGSEPLKACATTETQISWNEMGIPGMDGLPGSPGADGADGAQGEKGDQGPAGVSGLAGIHVVSGSGEPTALVYCPEGEIAVSGGGFSPSDQNALRVSRPIVSTLPNDRFGMPIGWEVNNLWIGTSTTLVAYAVCVPSP